MLAWVVYINNKYNIYRAPKIKNKKYPIKMCQILNKLKYRNAKYIYKQHLTEGQIEGDLTLKLGKFLTEECLENMCLQYIEEKKYIKYWLIVD